MGTLTGKIRKVAACLGTAREERAFAHPAF
jgi:hypothetical protein